MKGFPAKGRIGRKLLLINLVAAGAGLLLGGACFIANQINTLREDLRGDLETHARMIGSDCAAPLIFHDQRGAEETLAALKATTNIVDAALYALDGRIFATYCRQQDTGNRCPFPESPGQGLSFDGEYLSLYQDIILDKEPVGTIFVRSDTEPLRSHMLRDGSAGALAAALALGVASLLLWKLQKTITTPIFDLKQAMQAVSRDKNYALRARIFSEDEIGALSQGFNEMLAQIQDRDLQLQVEIEQRRRAEQEVQKLNEDLELRVEVRTRQLAEAREELLRKEKLAVLGQLSGSVGHELRTPLAIISNAVFYLKLVMPEADETVREYLDLIKSEVNNSERIISDLLDFARTKTPQTTEIAPITLIRQSLGKCDIAESVVLSVDISETLPLVKVDPLQMGQVFQNLITNAVQAMPNGGGLRISARMIHGPWPTARGKVSGELAGTGHEPAGDFIEIAVADTGEGISPENLKKLFQPLFTTKAKGMGLGLVVCGKLTAANGGTIEVESQPGQGTTFRVTLPA